MKKNFTNELRALEAEMMKVIRASLNAKNGTTNFIDNTDGRYNLGSIKADRIRVTSLNVTYMCEDEYYTLDIYELARFADKLNNN